VKITDPVRHAYLAEEIAKVERELDQGKIGIVQCSDLVRYLRGEQLKLERK